MNTNMLEVGMNPEQLLSKDHLVPNEFNNGNRRIMLLFPHPVSQPPGGIAAITPVFQNHGYEVQTFINTFGAYQTSEQMLAMIQAADPAVVGLSFSTFRILETYRLMRLLKEAGYYLIAGGVHPTIRPEESLSNGADLVVVGEAEQTLHELCLYWQGKGVDQITEIDGLCFQNENGSAQYTAPRKRITDLENWPLPDIETYDLSLFRLSDGTIKAGNKIFMSRGCPFQCTFCDRSVFGNQHVSRSAAHVVDQIVDLQQRYGYEEFALDDENFMVNKSLAHEICDLILTRNLRIRWLVGSHINTAEPQLLQLMKRAGCFQVIYGVESGDNETLKKVRKGYTRETVLETIRTTHQLGLQIYVNLMAGFPWETPRHVHNTMDLVNQIAPMIYAFQCYGAVVPYPCTPIYDEYAQTHGFVDWWLKPRFQNAGMVIYQNVDDPYKVSTYYQRNLYDDTYIYEDYFFNYRQDYKRAIRKLLFLLGRHNLKARYQSRAKQHMAYALGRMSRLLYEVNPRIEQMVVSLFRPRNRVHDTRVIARFVKS